MRARLPDRDGYVERDGVKVFYELFGAGAPTLLLPAWSIVHSRHWKAQVPYLARHFRVVTFDGRGNGRSDRPASAGAYADAEFVADAVAVLDATGSDQAVVAGLSKGGCYAVELAAAHPERVLGAVLIDPAIPFATHPERDVHPFDGQLDTSEGWAKFNRHYWRRNYRDFVEFFMGQVASEPHSTKQREDLVGWGLETTPETLALTVDAPGPASPEEWAPLCRQVRCPLLVIHGDQDAVRPHAAGAAAAELTGGTLVTIGGGGHAPHGRDPVKVNLLIKDFVDRVAGRAPMAARWGRARSRPRRALYLSSPIGLGHARLDLAIAQALRELAPDLEVDWLAQHPVTRVLEAAGERVHPASRLLASESAHFQDEAADHDLNAFQALRRMDEILVANFMLFHEVIADSAYDLVVGDEAWDVDYFWHEHPELKRTAFCWMTDFVGFVPMPEGGEAEALLTTDYNAEMLEQVARFPRVRDLAVFVGDPDDIAPLDFGPGLPRVRAWVEQHYAFAGYVGGFDPAALGDRQELRERLGYRPEEQVVVVTVGGSGVGGALLRRVVAAYPEAARRVDGLRMVAVAGPRIDPGSLQAPAGVEVLGYVADLQRHLAACDLAVVQGGLSTCMELVACRRPFLYVPCAATSSSRSTSPTGWTATTPAGGWTTATATPETIAAAIAEELDRPVNYRPVATDGAARAATLIAELL